MDAHRSRIEVTFPKPILLNEKYSYILSVLPEKTFIDKLGNLNIVEVPKIDLTEIILLPNTGKVLFNSAIGNIEKDPKQTGFRLTRQSRPGEARGHSHGRTA